MRRPSRLAAVAVVAVAAVLPCLVARWPPLYDYYHWVYHGHVLATLLRTGPGDAIHSLFGIDARPVPNLAISLGMTALNLVLAPPFAGRVFLAATVLLLGFGFFALTRSLQRRPTAVELFGFAWAYGYFAYAGYLGYLFSLGLALLTLAHAHRLLQREAPWRRRDLAGLAALVTLVWCAHLIAWVVLAGTLLVFAGVATLRKAWRRGVAVLAAFIPALVLLGWYTAIAWTTVVGPNASTEVYETLADKRISLIDPVLLFLRPDPLPPVAPIFWSNVVGLGLLALVALLSLQPRSDLATSDRRLGPTRVAGAMFGLLALFWPFGTLDGMGRPDERLALPAILFLLASLPLRRAGALVSALAAVPVLAVLGLHVVEFREGSRRIEQVLAVVRDRVPSDAPYLSLTVWDGRVEGGCEPSPAHASIGQPTLKWLALMRQIETGKLATHIMGSGLVSVEFPPERLEDLGTFIMKTREVAGWVGTGDAEAPPPVRTIAVLGCTANRLEAEKALARYYVPIESGESITVLQRR